MRTEYEEWEHERMTPRQADRVGGAVLVLFVVAFLALAGAAITQQVAAEHANPAVEYVR